MLTRSLVPNTLQVSSGVGTSICQVPVRRFFSTSGPGGQTFWPEKDANHWLIRFPNPSSTQLSMMLMTSLCMYEAPESGT